MRNQIHKASISVLLTIALSGGANAEYVVTDISASSDYAGNNQTSLNNHGVAVFCGYGAPDAAIYRYDGISTARISPGISSCAPLVNDAGDVFWNSYDPVNNVMFLEMWRDGNISLLQEGSYAYTELNDLDQLTWLSPVNVPISQMHRYIYDGTSIIQSTAPSVFGQPNHSYAFLIHDGNDYEIGYWDGAEEHRLTDNALNDYVVGSSGSGVFYTQYNADATRNLYYWEAGAVTEIEINISYYSHASVNGSGAVAWVEGGDYNNQSLYFWSAATGKIAIPAKAGGQGRPILTDDGQLFWDTISSDGVLEFSLQHWQDGVTTELFALVGNDTHILGLEVNDSGSAAVFWFAQGGAEHIAGWNGEVVQVLDSGGYTPSEDVKINDRGDIVWSSYTFSPFAQRVFYAAGATNAVPVADAGLDQAPHAGDLVTLNGNASYDPDWDSVPATPLNFSWTLTTADGTDITYLLDDPNSATPSFTVNSVGNFNASLIVNDGQDDSAADVVLISTYNVPPVADAGGNIAAVVDVLVALDGNGSSDADGDVLTYQWTLVSAPAGSATTLDSTNASTTQLTPDMVGTYVVGLTVFDGYAPSTQANVIIESMTLSGVVDSSAQEAYNAITEVVEISPDAFTTQQSAGTMQQKLSALVNGIKEDGSNLNNTINKIENDLLRRTDGCAERGTPDSNGSDLLDWVTSCEAQALIYPEIVDMLDYLKAQ